MCKKPFTPVAVLAVALVSSPSCAIAQATLRITIPRHSSLTYVQSLNRQGVRAVQRHDYAKAAGFFYKAYLYDPADPFTLNNLGYISELQGQLDRADKFYRLAAEQGSSADIDLSNVKRLEGKSMQVALAGIQDSPMRVNRLNVDAVRLLAQNRGAEATALLQQALALSPHDPFTINNLAVADEMNGDERRAMQLYSAVADSGSGEGVVVTNDPAWQGKSVSQMAEENLRRIEKQMQGAGSAESESLELSLRGVLAENANDWSAARQDFMRAYSLNPSNAFSLNNRGYVAERDGDLESAQFFYHKAEQADGAGLAVGLATDRSAKGMPLSRLASDSLGKVDGALEVYSQERRTQTGPVELTPRGNGAANASPSSGPPGSPNLAPPTSVPQSNQ